MFLRYAGLVALAAASLYAVINVSETSGRMLVDAGATGSNPNAMAFWVLAGIAGISGFSLCRFVLFGIPTMLGSWYHNHKEWLYTLLLGGVICGVFYLM
jgi:hypothetical protein